MVLFGGLLMLSVALSGASAATALGEDQGHGAHHLSMPEHGDLPAEEAGLAECALLCLAKRLRPLRPEGYRGLTRRTAVETGFAPILMAGQAPMPPWHPPQYA